jgi:hypothetical protein
VQVQQRQHLGHLRRLPGPRRHDRRREPLPLARLFVDALVVDPWRPHRHRSCGRGHLPLGVVAVADHQPVTVLVNLTAVRRDVGGHLGLQRSCQHHPRAVTNDRIQHRRPRRLTDSADHVGRLGVVDYLEHGRTLPNQRSNAGPDQNQRTSDHPREGALLRVTPPRAIHRF